jgi:hypothetical protein
MAAAVAVSTRVTEVVDRGSRVHKVAPLSGTGDVEIMTEPAILDLVRELDDPARRRDPELEVDLELVDDDMLLDPWFQLSEEEIAKIEDDPSAQVLEIRIEGYGTGLADSVWAF